MVFPTLSEHTIPIKQSPTGSAVPNNADRSQLLLLLEKMVTLIEIVWREEVRAKTSKDTETPRQAVLRQAHHTLAKWFEFETLSREAGA